MLFCSTIVQTTLPTRDDHEDFKNVRVFAIEAQCEDESKRDRSVLHTQMDICSYFLYISCHFLRFLDTGLIVLPEYCSFTLLGL